MVVAVRRRNIRRKEREVGPVGRRESREKKGSLSKISSFIPTIESKKFRAYAFQFPGGKKSTLFKEKLPRFLRKISGGVMGEGMGVAVMSLVCPEWVEPSLHARRYSPA